MRFSRTRYITLCQQSLVTAVVLVVGVSAAGIRTLDIVPAPSRLSQQPEAGSSAPMGPGSVAPRARPSRTPVETAPVTPRVREIEVEALAKASVLAGRDRAARRAPVAAGGHAESEEGSAGHSHDHSTAAKRTMRRVAISRPQVVRGYATVGVTWAPRSTYAENQLNVEIRTEKDSSWTPWTAAKYNPEEGPGQGKDGSGEIVRPGTDPLIIGEVDRVQMRLSTTDGSVPRDLLLAVIDPGTGRLRSQAPAIDTAELGRSTKGTDQAALSSASFSDATADPETATPDDDASLAAMKVAPKPYIYSRAQWGANERLRDQSSPYYGTVKAGFIHHTVNANSYSSSQVPSLLRGIYAYHTQSKGWRDVGYNFLVDRFGRIWEGRFGGVHRGVVGAHTMGYNEVSFAMSAIGNFDVTNPPRAVTSAYARLFAWKLSLHDIRADATRLYVKNRYLAAINGHRDTGQTACPGRYLYAKMPGIRTAAKRLQDEAQSGTPAPPPPPPATPEEPRDPVFTSPTQTPQPAVAQPDDIALPEARNLAGTPRPDLVLKVRSTGEIRVLSTGGQTGFDHSVSTPGDWAAMDLIAGAGDVSGDGKGDVVARRAEDGTTRVYRGNGLGQVRTSGVYETTRFQDADMITSAGDWNGDDLPDMLMRDKTRGALHLVPGTGRGGFGAPVRLSASWSAYTSTAVAGDLTRDGRPDIVAVRAGVVYVVPNTASGALGAPLQRQTIGTAYNAVLGGAHDLNGDSTGDLILRSADTGRLGILVGRSDATFGPTLGSFPSPEGYANLSAAQMMGGAQPDVVGTDATGSRLIVLPSNGEVNAYKRISSGLRVPDATQLLNVGDWNRDGKGDIITRQSGGDVLVFRPGLGDGTFGTRVVMGAGWTSLTRLAAVGDVTGDGFPDLVGKTTSGPMTIFPGNGKSGFEAPALAPSSLRTFNQIGGGSWKPGEMPGSSYRSSDGSFVPFSGTSGTDPAEYDLVIGPGEVSGNEVADMVARDADGTLWLLPGTTRGFGERRFLTGGYAGYSLIG